MASIQIIQGPDRGKTLELREGENILGRQSGSLELTDNTVSRRHFMLSRQGGRWVLTDLGSANGTYLNGVKLSKPAPLNRGDQIRCGGSLLVFIDVDGRVARSGSVVDVDENGNLVEASIVATLPSNEDSVIIPTPEAGATAIDNLRFLYELIREQGTVFNVDQLLDHILARIFDILPADRGFTMLITDDGKLNLKSSRFAKGVADETPPISRTIINEVLNNQLGVLSTNAMSDKRFAAGKSVHNYGIRSAVCVPIKGRDKILGIIHLDCSLSEHTYSTEQLRLLTAIGYQTGLAVDNIRLHLANVQQERLAAAGETVAVLSHHIKNILQALGAGTDVVEMALNANNIAKAKSAWPIVQRNLGRINGFILNMLAFSKDREPLMVKTDVNEVLEDCVSLVSAAADERGVAVVTELGEDLPMIPADADGLRQALLNLVNNAMDAVRDNAGIITLKSRYEKTDGSVMLTVIDNGAGIAPEQMDKIFNPFYSGKGQRGTGLGLAVARKIVNEHHGKIDVESTPGEGTSFAITLPISRPAMETTSAPAIQGR
ncbi:MAG: FHA domain-containing protein [Planctomycetaceae bacterium]|nr:FHA domain-containing protein [Planctomycetaceae bacterium]